MRQIITFPASHQAQAQITGPNNMRPVHRLSMTKGVIQLSPSGFGEITSDQNKAQFDRLCSSSEFSAQAAANNISTLIPNQIFGTPNHISTHIEVNLESNQVMIYAQVCAHSAFEIDALSLIAAQTAQTVLYNWIRKMDPESYMRDTLLIVGTDDRGIIWVHPSGAPEWVTSQIPKNISLAGKSVSILIMSDRAANGTYADACGPLIKNLLDQSDAEIKGTTIIPDNADDIEKTLRHICAHDAPDLIIASGGTGPGPRDITPDILAKICDRMLDGLGDYLRHESMYFTDTAWLSRMTAGMMGHTLVIAFPGSPKAAQECWDILVPILGTALTRIRKQGFEKP